MYRLQMTWCKLDHLISGTLSFEQWHRFVHSRFAFTHLHLFEHVFYTHISTVLGNLWKGRPAWTRHIVISCLVLTPPILWWKFRVSDKTLSPNMASLINSPFQVLVEGMGCRWNSIHLPVLSGQIRSSFIHLRANARWYNKTTNLSICFMSAKDTSHGSCDSLANNGVRWGILRQTVQAVFLPISRKAETVSHPENPCSSSNPQSTSNPNNCEIRWHGI